jgi:hypothetical protein
VFGQGDHVFNLYFNVPHSPMERYCGESLCPGNLGAQSLQIPVDPFLVFVLACVIICFSTQ